MHYLAIDIGGTWIKGVLADRESGFRDSVDPDAVRRIQSRLHKDSRVGDFISVINDLIGQFPVRQDEIGGIGISTPGIVDYHGTRVLKAASHVEVLKNSTWKDAIEQRMNCPVSLINDADAAAIGLAETGYLTGNRTIGIMPVGTGLGFSVWRNGRRWRPGKSLTLLGSIRLPDSSFDSVASASRLASLDPGGNLAAVLGAPEFRPSVNAWLDDLAGILNSAAILYSLDEVIVCGGLADAAVSCGFGLESELNDRLSAIPPERDQPLKARVAAEGNRLQLIGALAVAAGESVAARLRVRYHYKALETEVPYKSDMHLEKMDTAGIIQALWTAEQEAGEGLKESLPEIVSVADQAAERLRRGGRLIYAGAGTSGRIAAMDAVEIPCTYGFPEDRILALISGGISDAAIEIESDFEEDASSVPDMLLLNVREQDVVIGISASGSAYYVQSALAFAGSRGALTVMVQTNKPAAELPFCQQVISLNSGNEVVAGSTRMKAGTATKKVLNFLSSAVMIRLGKVAGPYMIDVACINNKLVDRARSILGILYGLSGKQASELLEANAMDLGKAIRALEE